MFVLSCPAHLSATWLIWTLPQQTDDRTPDHHHRVEQLHSGLQSMPNSLQVDKLLFSIRQTFRLSMFFYIQTALWVPINRWKTPQTQRQEAHQATPLHVCKSSGDEGTEKMRLAQQGHSMPEERILSQPLAPQKNKVKLRPSSGVGGRRSRRQVADTSASILVLAWRGTVKQVEGPQPLAWH